MVFSWVKVRLTAPAFREARSLTTAVLLCAATRCFVVDHRTTPQHTRTRQPKHRRICNLEGPRISSQERLYWKDARAFPADKILSTSMQPALELGDRILVDKASVFWGKLPGQPPGLGLRRGDVVVFRPPKASRPLYAELLHLATGTTTAPVGEDAWHKFSLQQAWKKRRKRMQSPLNQSLDFTKRVVALAGDRVGVRKGVLHVNDRPADPLPGASASADSVRASYSLHTTVVPKDHIMVFGDNRGASFDSHVWGPLPVRNVIGCARARYWPFKRAAWFGRGEFLHGT